TKMKYLEAVLSFLLSLAGLLFKSPQKGKGRPCDCRPAAPPPGGSEPADAGDGGDAGLNRSAADAPGAPSSAPDALNAPLLLGYCLLLSAALSRLLR
ncbi:MAG: hypothetical protein LBS88_10305, partial [Tannerellaceae bacterium]|nr:hypothetical protein [Tannerellaceae bacterium]